MATKLSKSDLPQLLSWLETHLPRSFKIYGELQSHLRGKFPDLDFYADRWPDPQAAAAVVDRAGEQLKGGEYYSKYNIVLGLFGESDEALTVLLKDNRIMDWTKNVLLTGMADKNVPAIMAFTGEMGISPMCVPCVLMKATKEDFQFVPLPEGMTVSSIGEEELETVISNWKYGANGGMGYARDQLAHFPSVVLKSECGEHVGHMLGYTFRTIGMLHVLPQFRRKGYAKVIISQLVQKYFDMGEDAYVNIEIDNEVSVKLHESLGFKAVPDMQITWVAHFPEDR